MKTQHAHEYQKVCTFSYMLKWIYLTVNINVQTWFSFGLSVSGILSAAVLLLSVDWKLWKKSMFVLNTDSYNTRTKGWHTHDANTNKQVSKTLVIFIFSALFPLVRSPVTRTDMMPPCAFSIVQCLFKMCLTLVSCPTALITLKQQNNGGGTARYSALP